MEQLEKFQIIFNNPSAIYNASDTVYGYGWAVFKEPLHVQSKYSGHGNREQVQSKNSGHGNRVQVQSKYSGHGNRVYVQSKLKSWKKSLCTI